MLLLLSMLSTVLDEIAHVEVRCPCAQAIMQVPSRTLTLGLQCEPLMCGMYRRVVCCATSTSSPQQSCCAAWISLVDGSTSIKSVTRCARLANNNEVHSKSSLTVPRCLVISFCALFVQRWLDRMCWSRDDVVGRFGSPIAAYMPFITQHPQAQVSLRRPSHEFLVDNELTVSHCVIACVCMCVDDFLNGRAGAHPRYLRVYNCEVIHSLPILLLTYC